MRRVLHSSHLESALRQIHFNTFVFSALAAYHHENERDAVSLGDEPTQGVACSPAGILSAAARR
jgi:hypothetical protein